MTIRKNVLITGASAGIGAATARLAALKGYNVGIGYHSDKAGAEAVQKDDEAAGGKAVLLQGDIADPDAIAKMFALFDETLGRLDVLVNNAGIAAQPSRVEDLSAERVKHMFEVNVLGVFTACGLAVKRMGKGGVIVNVSSIAPRLGAANQYVDYAASKGAIDVLTKGLAIEVAEQGIRVAGIAPGIVDTGIHAKGGLPDRAKDLAHMIPMQRAGTPEEIANAILWVMSDEASYVTGSTLDVSGGR